MEKLWNVVAILAGIAGIFAFATFAIFILPYLAAVSAIGFGMFIVVGLAAAALKMLVSRRPGEG